MKFVSRHSLNSLFRDSIVVFSSRKDYMSRHVIDMSIVRFEKCYFQRTSAYCCFNQYFVSQVKFHMSNLF